MANAENAMMIPPGVDPSDWLQAQRDQLIAGIALQNSQQPIQPQNYGRIASRASPLSAVARVAEAYMSRKAQDQANALTGKSYAAALSQFQNGGAPSAPPGAALAAGDDGTGAPPPAPSAPAPPSTSGGPLSIPGLDPRTAMSLYMSSPADYAKLKVGPESVQLARIAGLPAAPAATAAFNKQNALEERPGGATVLPNGTVLRNPQLSAGEVPVYDQQGNLIGTRLLPGHAEAQGAITGTETAARVANTPLEVPMGGGSERLAYPGDVRSVGTPPAMRGPQNMLPIMDQSGQVVGYRAGSGATPAAPTLPPRGSYFPPQPPSAPAAAAGSSGAAPTSIAPPSAASIAQAGATPTGGQASPAGANGLWSDVPQLNIPVTPGQTQNDLQKGRIANAVAKDRELSDTYGSNANLADARIAFNKEALSVLNGAETGPLSDELTKLRAKAQELGVPASWIPGADTVGDTQLLKKFALRNPLLNLKPTFGGRPAAAEFTILANDASPSPLMMKSVFGRLAQLDTQQAQYQKQQATDYNQYVTQHQGDPMRFESWYAAKRPLANYFAQQATPPAALQRLQQQPHTLPDFRAKYGWDPTQ